jgi:2-amino-4-hydroxy-6-hydroxymethyldihydropteridine diphosphokinase
MTQTQEPVEAWNAFGSNLGDRRGNLRQALEALSREATILSVSPLYATEPVGYADQGWFLNGVVRIATGHAPRELLDILHVIERRLGRERRVRNGPRTIDLDILTWDAAVIDEPGLTLPHPRAHERLFVVAPWADLAPGLILPAAGKPLAEIRRTLEGTAQVEQHVLPPW